MGSSVACSPRVLLCCFPGPFPERSGCPEPVRFPPRDPMTLFWEAQGGAEGDWPPGGLRAVARCLEPAAHEALLVAEVGAGLVVHDAVLLAFVLDSREMKPVVFLVAGPTLPCLARFLLPLQWSHRHRRHVTAPPELLSRACRRLSWPGGSWPPSCGQPPAPEPVPSGWQRWKLSIHVTSLRNHRRGSASLAERCRGASGGCRLLLAASLLFSRGTAAALGTNTLGSLRPLLPAWGGSAAVTAAVTSGTAPPGARTCRGRGRAAPVPGAGSL